MQTFEIASYVLLVIYPYFTKQKHTGSSLTLVTYYLIIIQLVITTLGVQPSIFAYNMHATP